MATEKSHAYVISPTSALDGPGRSVFLTPFSNMHVENLAKAGKSSGCFTLPSILVSKRQGPLLNLNTREEVFHACRRHGSVPIEVCAASTYMEI